MTATSAKVVKDSITADGCRLTTFELHYQRYIHAELMTHRVFSRNSASARAIPLRKQLAKVIGEPALPPLWGSEQKGMQAGGEIDDPAAAEDIWLRARTDAAAWADRLGQLGVHKSLANRIIEPFITHTVIVTATAYGNWFALRNNPLAEPAIRDLAELMEDAHDSSVPELVHEGMWHLPYIDREDITAAEEYLLGAHGERGYGKPDVTKLLIQMSSARCARTSYETQDGKRDPAEDLSLYERLTTATPMHGSPLEHVATPAPWNQHDVTVTAMPPFVEYGEGQVTTPLLTLALPMYGNLVGWHQHRFDVEAHRQYRAFS